MRLVPQGGGLAYGPYCQPPTAYFLSLALLSFSVQCYWEKKIFRFGRNIITSICLTSFSPKCKVEFHSWISAELWMAMGLSFHILVLFTARLLNYLCLGLAVSNTGTQNDLITFYCIFLINPLWFFCSSFLLRFSRLSIPCNEFAMYLIEKREATSLPQFFLPEAPAYRSFPQTSP